MKPLLLTFDLEEFDLPVELLGRDLDRAEQFAVSRSGVERLLPLLGRHEVRATFFTTGTFAWACPETVCAIARAGHEVAVHGLAHGDDYAALDPDEARERLRAARRLVERASGSDAVGVRTPRLRVCQAAVLRDAGFTYDASPHPTWVPGRYNGLRWPRSPWNENGVLRVPISVLPGMRLPVAWVWYRLAGRRVGWLVAAAAARGAPYLQLYFHPWEATRIDRFVPAWLAVRTGEAFLQALDHLLSHAAGRFRPFTVRRFAEEYRSGA